MKYNYLVYIFCFVVNGYLCSNAQVKNIQFNIHVPEIKAMLTVSSFIEQDTILETYLNRDTTLYIPLTSGKRIYNLRYSFLNNNNQQVVLKKDFLITPDYSPVIDLSLNIDDPVYIMNLHSYFFQFNYLFNFTVRTGNDDIESRIYEKYDSLNRYYNKELLYQTFTKLKKQKEYQDLGYLKLYDTSYDTNQENNMNSKRKDILSLIEKYQKYDIVGHFFTTLVRTDKGFKENYGTYRGLLDTLMLSSNTEWVKLANDYIEQRKNGIEKVKLVGWDPQNDPVPTELTQQYQYTFVYFWASWCGPCVKNIVKIADILQEKSDKFRFVFISLDTDRDQWLNKINYLKIGQHMNINDFKGFYGQNAIYYDISYIPRNLLLNDKNEILKENITMDVLKEYYLTTSSSQKHK